MVHLHHNVASLLLLLFPKRVDSEPDFVKSPCASSPYWLRFLLRGAFKIGTHISFVATFFGGDGCFACGHCSYVIFLSFKSPEPIPVVWTHSRFPSLSMFCQLEGVSSESIAKICQAHISEFHRDDITLTTDYASLRKTTTEGRKHPCQRSWHFLTNRPYLPLCSSSFQEKIQTISALLPVRRNSMQCNIVRQTLLGAESHIFAFVLIDQHGKITKPDCVHAGNQI